MQGMQVNYDLDGDGDSRDDVAARMTADASIAATAAAKAIEEEAPDTWE